MPAQTGADPAQKGKVAWPKGSYGTIESQRFSIRAYCVTFRRRWRDGALLIGVVAR